MKRSDAVQLILSVYNKNVYQDYEMHEEEADDILFELEKAGMKPPMVKEKSFQLLDDGQLTYEVNEWEPENE